MSSRRSVDDAGFGRRAAARIGSIALWIAAGIGVAGAGVALLTAFGLVQPLVVVSQSMQPAISAGDLLVAVRVPARELRAGDIVSVPTDGSRRFITHRVVETEATADGSWALRLRGDANEAADPAPYEVGDSVLKVVWVVPIAARAEAAWTDAVVGGLALESALAAPAPYEMAMSIAWNQMAATSQAVCPEGQTVEQRWVVDGGFAEEQGASIALGVAWDVPRALANAARCSLGAKASEWTEASNNPQWHLMRSPSFTPHIIGGQRTAVWDSLSCPDFTTGWELWGTIDNRSGHLDLYWSGTGYPPPSMSRYWNVTWGAWTVAGTLRCHGPWGAADVWRTQNG